MFKHQLNKLREKSAIEHEEQIQQRLAQVDAEYRHRETQLREKFIKERDAEIEMVIQRLESEGSLNTTDAAHSHRIEIERLRSEHADEVKQVYFSIRN
jgi:hypothetical protein